MSVPNKDFRKNFKILVIKTRAMGDTILTSAALTSLGEQFPGAEIHVLVPRVWSSLIENHPNCSKIHRWQKKESFLGWVWRIRREKFDVVIALHAGQTSARLARVSGAPVRSVHFHGLNEKNHHSTVEISGKGQVKPILQRDHDALRAVGVEKELASSTQVFLTESEQQEGKAWFESHSVLGAREGAPLLALGLGASRPTKCWPIEKYQELALEWKRRTQGKVLLVVGPSEQELTLGFADHCAVLCEKDLRLTAAILSRCDLFIGNDSGPKHMAVAVGVKTITVFGPENPFEWHPYDRKEHPVVFHDGLSCRASVGPENPAWCGIEVCKKENHRCMKDIQVREVVELWPHKYLNF